MKAKITPTENISQLKDNLEKQAEKVERKQDTLEVEIDEPEKLERVPGIKKIKLKGDTEEERKGLKGKPVDELAYARLESWKDTVQAFLATVQGWNLVVLETDRKWDLRNLRKYNPDIKKLKSQEPVEELELNKSIADIEGMEKIDVETPDENKQRLIYREMLT